MSDLPYYGIDPGNAPEIWWDPGAKVWVIDTDRVLSIEELRYAMNDTYQAQVRTLSGLWGNPKEFDECAESVLALTDWHVVQRIRAPETRPTIVTVRR